MCPTFLFLGATSRSRDICRTLHYVRVNCVHMYPPVSRSQEASVCFDRRLVVRGLGRGKIGSAGECREGGREKRGGFRSFPLPIFPARPPTSQYYSVISHRWPLRRREYSPLRSQFITTCEYISGLHYQQCSLLSSGLVDQSV